MLYTSRGKRIINGTSISVSKISILGWVYVVTTCGPPVAKPVCATSAWVVVSFAADTAAAVRWSIAFDLDNARLLRLCDLGIGTNGANLETRCLYCLFLRRTTCAASRANCFAFLALFDSLCGTFFSVAALARRRRGLLRRCGMTVGVAAATFAPNFH